jgi:hypothetical protein
MLQHSSRLAAGASVTTGIQNTLIGGLAGDALLLVLQYALAIAGGSTEGAEILHWAGALA